MLFINPNPLPESPWYSKQSIPPIGLMYIAALLDKKGYNVKIIDAYLEKLDQMQLSRRILNYNPDIVGITTDSCNFFESLRIGKLVKIISNAIVVMGGPHATIRAKETIQYPEVDVVVIGEGEITMLDIVQRIEKEKSLIGCQGCIFKENGKIIFNPPRKRIEDLNSLPFPARYLLPYKYYSRTYSFGKIKTPVDTVNTSRGCPYNCSFCSSRMIWSAKYKARSPKNIADEIEYLVNEYGTKGIYFREDNFTLKKKRVIGICYELRRRKIDIEWECSSRVDLVDKKLLKMMYQAGCRAIWYGIESGSKKTLDIINKGITIEQIKKAVKFSREAGIKVGGSFIIGIPGESMEDIKETFFLVQELKLTTTAMHYFYGVPDSQLYREVVKNGWIDSVYGDILFVKTPIFDKKKMEKILNIFKEMTKKNFLKLNPINALRYSITLMKNPKRIVNFLRNYNLNFKAKNKF